jgi:hypothetical protein
VIKPLLTPQPYELWIANILARFEDGKPLTSEQLNFLLTHEKSLGSHALDLVIKYYLTAHQHEHGKSLAFTIPKEKVDSLTLHELHATVENLLNHNLSHIDLKMTLEQFLQFKAAGVHELHIWHGPQFLSRAIAFPQMMPQAIYLQWGKLFGVVKLNSHVENFDLDGYALIYLEDMSERNILTCVREYAKKYKIEPPLTPQNTLTETPQEKLVERPTNWPPTLKPGMYHPSDKEDDKK